MLSYENNQQLDGLTKKSYCYQPSCFNPFISAQCHPFCCIQWPMLGHQGQQTFSHFANIGHWLKISHILGSVLVQQNSIY